MASRDPPSQQSDDSVTDPATKMICNVLVIGDSHCRDLDVSIAKAYPNVKSYIISVGQQTDSIMEAYFHELQQVTSFKPDFIILHTGHNEIAYHRTKNTIPKDSTQTTVITISAATVLQNDHPKAVIIISSIFPRCLTMKSSLRQQDLLHYNRTAERHGRRLHTEASKIHLHVFKNNFMWKSKSDILVKTHLFLRDGLHLTNEAKSYVISRWMGEIYKMLPTSHT
jgi:hypothetical protein